MQKLKSELLTEWILEILKEVKKLEKRYEDFVDFKIIKGKLGDAEKLLHELTLELKNKEK